MFLIPTSPTCTIRKQLEKTKEISAITKEVALLSDYDPRVIEQKELQQPACLPLSYVLRFFSDATRKEGLDAKRKLAQNPGTKASYATTTRSNTPTGNFQF
jgi:hypothetical protein